MEASKLKNEAQRLESCVESLRRTIQNLTAKVEVLKSSRRDMLVPAKVDADASAQKKVDDLADEIAREERELKDLQDVFRDTEKKHGTLKTQLAAVLYKERIRQQAEQAEGLVEFVARIDKTMDDLFSQIDQAMNMADAIHSRAPHHEMFDSVVARHLGGRLRHRFPRYLPDIERVTRGSLAEKAREHFQGAGVLSRA